MTAGGVNMNEKNTPWKIHSTEELLHTPIFKVNLDKSECPRRIVKAGKISHGLVLNALMIYFF